MSNDDRPRSRVGIVLFVVVLVLLVVLVIVGIVVQSNNRQPAESGSGAQPSAPASAAPSAPSNPDPTTTTKPSEVMDDVEEEDLPEVYNPVVSDIPQPTNEQILAYEQAYFTPDPVQRETLMKPLATDQYLTEELSREPAKYEGIEVRVVPVETEIQSVTVGDTRFTAYVVTQVFLETVRDGKVVNQFSGPRHSSVWVNTEDGWRVATNAGEG